MRTAIKVGAGAVGLLLALWAVSGWLKPLGSILPATAHLLSTARAVLTETQRLQSGIGLVQGNLHEMERQDQLLAEQEELTRSVLVQLKRQEELSILTRDRLATILTTEKDAVDLIKQADRAGAAAMPTVTANAAELERLTAQTRRIEAGSESMDAQLDRMNGELESSAENFAGVARIKAAASAVTERATNWWDRVMGWFDW